jgi:hypothetical protein
MRNRLIEILKKSGASFENALPEEIADHLLAHGVIAPPCYIGQEIWHITKHYDGRIEIRKGKVSMLQQKSDKSWKIRITVNSSVWDFTPNEIGTEYFLTREEAERALERSKNGKS